jgi:hypothetical protein
LLPCFKENFGKIEWTKEPNEELQLHPVDSSPDFLRTRGQTASFAYIKGLGRAIAEYEKLVPNIDRSATYWLDSLVTDQNGMRPSPRNDGSC